MTGLSARDALRAATVLALTAGSFMLSSGRSATGQTATGWSLGDPIVDYWNGGTTTELVAEQAVDGGFNVVQIMGNPGIEHVLTQLDVAQEYGLRGRLYSDVYLSPASLDGGAAQAQLDEMIDAFKAHPAAYEYFIPGIGDETHLDDWPDLLELRSYINQRDPDHLVYINLGSGLPNWPSYGFDTYEEHIEAYVNTFQPEMLSYDDYPFQYSDAALTTEIFQPSYFYTMALISQTARELDVPFMNTVNAVTYLRGGPWPRIPTLNEYRFVNYTTLAYGGQGISYWKYAPPEGFEGGLQLNPDGTETEVYQNIASINPEFLAVAKQIQFQSLKSVGGFHLGDQPPGTVRLPGNSPFTLSPAIPDTTYVYDPEACGCQADPWVGLPVEGMLIGLFGPDDNVTNATFAIVVNLDYESNVTTTLNGPGDLSIFDITTGTTWSATGQSSVTLNLEPGGGVLVGLTSATRLLGDFNDDGDINLSDYYIMKANWLTTGQLLNENGEVTGDGIVDLHDYGMLKDTLFPGLASALLNVPEPSSSILLAIAMCCLLSCGRGIQSHYLLV